MTASATGAAPLSVAQEALWYAAILAPQRLSYNETVSIRRAGAFDAAAFRRAFAELVRRHAAWRTTFDTLAGEPVQVVWPAPAFALPLIDLAGLAPEAAERQAVRVVADVSRVPYDLRRGPLVRPRLFRFPGSEHRLYLAMHHIVFDGVSVYRVVLPELIALYDAFAAGAPSPLAEPETAYADYARWEQEWIDGPRAARRLAHWDARLAGLPEPAFPLDRPRPEAPRFRGGVVEVAVPRAVVDRLRAIGRGSGATLFQALAASWALLLARWSEQDDVVFATAADLRQRPEFEGLVGYCLTPLVLRVDVGGDPAFGELMVRVRNELLDGLDNAVPFERLVRSLPPTGGASGNPVFQTLLVLEPAAVAPDPAWSVHQMESGIGDAVGTTKLDLELELDERPEGHLAGRLIYDSDLFDRATVERVAEHWSRVVSAVAADPGLRASGVPLLTADEECARMEWNATATERPDVSAHELVRARALTQPDAPAVVCGDAVCSYGELAKAVAGELDLRGVTTVVRALAGAGSDASVVNAVLSVVEAVGLSPADTVLVLPASLARFGVTELLLPLAAGARLVLASPEAAADGRAVSRLITAEGVSFLHAAPSTWRALVDTRFKAARSLRGLSSGEPLSRALADELLRRCRVLWNAYGTAETAGFATLGRVAAEAPVTIGRPLANTHASVLDRRGRPAPVGVYGELRIGTVATGDRARHLPGGVLELAEPPGG